MDVAHQAPFEMPHLGRDAQLQSQAIGAGHDLGVIVVSVVLYALIDAGLNLALDKARRFGMHTRLCQSFEEL
jgi:hypothetical protein